MYKYFIKHIVNTLLLLAILSCGNNKIKKDEKDDLEKQVNLLREIRKNNKFYNFMNYKTRHKGILYKYDSKNKETYEFLLITDNKLASTNTLKEWKNASKLEEQAQQKARERINSTNKNKLRAIIEVFLNERTKFSNQLLKIINTLEMLKEKGKIKDDEKIEALAKYQNYELIQYRSNDEKIIKSTSASNHHHPYHHGLNHHPHHHGSNHGPHHNGFSGSFAF